jgi:hypothetical protein
MKNLAEFNKEFIESQVFEKNKDGKEEFSIDLLAKLAKANGIDAADVAAQVKRYKPATAGLVRMAMGNMIRGALAHNRKAVTINGATKSIPENLLPKPVVKKEKKPAKAKKQKKKAA